MVVHQGRTQLSLSSFVGYFLQYPVEMPLALSKASVFRTRGTRRNPSAIKSNRSREVAR